MIIFLFGMNDLVRFQIFKSRKFLIAHVTFMFFHSCVRQHVGFQMVTSAKTFAAGIAMVLLLIGMDGKLMELHVSTFCKSFLTNSTFMVFNTCMGKHMIFQMMVSEETLFTQIAPMPSILGMNKLMSLKISFLSETLLTHGAHKPFIIGMNPLMFV